MEAADSLHGHELQPRSTNPAQDPTPSTSAHALEKEEGLDALFLACSQQFEQELKTEQKMDALLPTCNWLRASTATTVVTVEWASP